MEITLEDVEKIRLRIKYAAEQFIKSRLDYFDQKEVVEETDHLLEVVDWLEEQILRG